MTNTARKTETISFKRAMIELHVDQLCRANLAIAKLQEEADRHAEFLKALRPGRYEGKEFMANVSARTRVTLDPKLVRQYFIRNGLDVRWLKRNSKSTSFRALTWGRL